MYYICRISSYSKVTVQTFEDNFLRKIQEWEWFSKHYTAAKYIYILNPSQNFIFLLVEGFDVSRTIWYISVVLSGETYSWDK